MIFLNPHLPIIASRLAAYLHQLWVSEAVISRFNSLTPQFHQQKATHSFSVTSAFCHFKDVNQATKERRTWELDSFFFGADKLLGELSLFNPAAL